MKAISFGLEPSPSHIKYTKINKPTKDKLKCINQ